MAGSASAGRKSSAAKAGARPNRSHSSPRWRTLAHPVRRTAPASRSSRRLSFYTAPRSNSMNGCPPSAAASAPSPWATASRRPVPISRRSAPAPCAMATTGSSMDRSCGPPAANMVGAVNNGWKVITDALAAERVMIGGTRMAGIERAFDHLTEYLKTAVVGGKALKNDPVIRDRIGALAADIEVARQFQMRNSWLVEQGRVPIHEAAMGKVFASELQERLGQAALDILGTGGLLSEDSESAPVGEMEQVLRHAIMGMIGGGTNEIQRNVIAQRGLDLPR